jgi:TIR domain
MASLADARELVGFFSYSREDDEGSDGKLSKLRERIQEELRAQLGRKRNDFKLFQDHAAIASGTLWEKEIKSAIAQSVFFIPIITPTAVRSPFCKFEFDAFLQKEKELARSDLIFPILWITVPALTDDRWRQDPLLKIVGSRQYEKWQSFRHSDPSSPEVARQIEKFCTNICVALQRTPLKDFELSLHAAGPQVQAPSSPSNTSDRDESTPALEVDITISDFIGRSAASQSLAQKIEAVANRHKVEVGKVVYRPKQLRFVGLRGKSADLNAWAEEVKKLELVSSARMFWPKFRGGPVTGSS